MPFTCAINGPQYDLSITNQMRSTSSVIDAKEVLPEGLIVRQGTPMAGRTAPNMFYVAFDYYGGHSFGAGNPPANSARALGGIGPIIIDGMPYGVGTVCKKPANCKTEGPPPPGVQGYMTQRNNRTYKAHLAVFQYEADKAAENMLSKMRSFRGTLLADVEHQVP